MIVEEIMNRNVHTIESGTLLQEAAQIMVDSHTKYLIVTKKGKLSGILTEWDFVRKAVAEGMDIKKLKVDDVMTEDVVIVKPDTDVEEAAKVMKEHDIKKLPVVTGSILVGLVTAMDIVAAHPKFMKQISNLLVLPSKRGKQIAG